MKYFTDSPFERMMMQKPSTRPRAKGSTAKAGCEGCGYGEKGPCIAVCMRKLSAPEERITQEQAQPEKGEVNETDHL